MRNQESKQAIRRIRAVMQGMTLCYGEGNEMFSRAVSQQKDTWNHIRTSSNQVAWQKGVWFTHATPKFSFCTWLALQDRLSTGDRMQRWNNGYNRVMRFLCCGHRILRPSLLLLSIRLWNSEDSCSKHSQYSVHRGMATDCGLYLGYKSWSCSQFLGAEHLPNHGSHYLARAERKTSWKYHVRQQP